MKFIVLLISVAAVSTLWSMEQLEEIKKEYGITDKNSCNIAISKDLADLTEGKSLDFIMNFQVACLLSGFKDVYLGTLELSQELERLDPRLSKLIKARKVIDYLTTRYSNFNTQVVNEAGPVLIALSELFNFDPQQFFTSRWYLFTPAGKRNGLLLALHNLSTEQGLANHSTYLIGKLLGYREQDMQFFSQLYGFDAYYKQRYNRELPQNIGDYRNWIPELKEEYTTYEMQVWPTSAQKSAFNQEKAQAEQWITTQNDSTDEDLLAEIQRLEKGALLQSKELVELIEKNIKTLKEALV